MLCELPDCSCSPPGRKRKVVTGCSVLRMSLGLIFKLSSGECDKWGCGRPSRVPRTEKGRWLGVLVCGKLPLVAKLWVFMIQGVWAKVGERGWTLRSPWSVLPHAEEPWGTYNWNFEGWGIFFFLIGDSSFMQANASSHVELQKNI